jgi:hypothetical protein
LERPGGTTYGEYKSQQLAAWSSAQATCNADNYALFAMAAWKYTQDGYRVPPEDIEHGTIECPEVIQEDPIWRKPMSEIRSALAWLRKNLRPDRPEPATGGLLALSIMFLPGIRNKIFDACYALLGLFLKHPDEPSERSVRVVYMLAFSIVATFVLFGCVELHFWLIQELLRP